MNSEPRTSSRRKIESARANGALSRGPKSSAGKLRSAANSLKHGLTAQTVVLSTEDPRRYAALRASYVHLLQPRNQLERDLVDSIVASLWRQRRALGMESALLDVELDAQRDSLREEFSEISPDVETALAFRADVREQGSLALLHRYEGRLSRQYLRLVRMLLDLRVAPLDPLMPGDWSQSASEGLASDGTETQATDALSDVIVELPNEPNPISEHQAPLCRFVRKRAPGVQSSESSATTNTLADAGAHRARLNTSARGLSFLTSEW